MPSNLYFNSDSFEAGYQFLGGGRLGYPKTPEHLDRGGYKKFTTVLILLCHINEQVYDVLLSN